MCSANGPPLSLDLQLRRLPQPQVFHPVGHVCVACLCDDNVHNVWYPVQHHFSDTLLDNVGVAVRGDYGHLIGDSPLCLLRFPRMVDVPSDDHH